MRDGDEAVTGSGGGGQFTPKLLFYEQVRDRQREARDVSDESSRIRENSGGGSLESAADDDAAEPAPEQVEQAARQGQMVVAITPAGEATLKRWFPEAHRIRLEPANSKMKPIYVKDAQILGVVVGVVRQVAA